MTVDLYKRIPAKMRLLLIKGQGEVFGWNGAVTPVRGDAWIMFDTPAQIKKL
jgi:hypothetical protein